MTHPGSHASPLWTARLLPDELGLPDVIAHRGYALPRFIGHEYMTSAGIFGTPLQVAATYIVLFTIYGAVLNASGAGKFFVDVSFAAFRKSRTAPGRTAATAGFLLIPFDRVRSTRLLLILAASLLLQPFLLLRIVAGHYGAAWALADPFFYNDGGAMRPSLFGSFGELVQANFVAGKVSKWSYYLETGRIVQILGLYLIGLVLGRERYGR